MSHAFDNDAGQLLSLPSEQIMASISNYKPDVVFSSKVDTFSYITAV